MDDAACAGNWHEFDFFPGKGNLAIDARLLCQRCPVRWRCLEYGMPETHGIWGGATERQRRRLRKLPDWKAVVVRMCVEDARLRKFVEGGAGDWRNWVSA